MVGLQLLLDIDAELNHLNHVFPDQNLSTGLSSKYYIIDSINREVQISNLDLSILHYNIQSLPAKYDSLVAEVSQLGFKFDIMCFTESWLTPESKDSVYFESYSAYHSLRPGGRRGGGISVYVRETFNVTVLEQCTVSSEHIESLFIEVCIGTSKFILGVVYRCPSSSHAVFTEKLCEIIPPLISVCGRNLIICGDFNYDFLQYDTSAPVKIFLTH